RRRHTRSDRDWSSDVCSSDLGLVCVLIGKDPFTGEVVERTVDNIVKGFFSLLDGGEAQYEELKKSGAIDRIVAKVEAAVTELNRSEERRVGKKCRAGGVEENE